MYRIVFSKGNFFTLIVFGMLISCSNINEQLPYYNNPDFTPVFIQNTKEVPDGISHQIDNFSFTDENGKTISEKDIEGKVHVANFIFTSCGSICPKMTENLKKAGKYFEHNNKVVFLSFSVTPWVDDVVKLKDYKQSKKITNPNWHFLTGNKEEIYRLARRSYFAEEDLGFTKDSTEFLHTEHILLVDKTKRIRGIYNGTLKLDIDQLITDINTLLKE